LNEKYVDDVIDSAPDTRYPEHFFRKLVKPIEVFCKLSVLQLPGSELILDMMPGN